MTDITLAWHSSSSSAGEEMEENAMAIDACRGKGICLCCMLKICQVMGKTNERIRCERLSGHYQNDNDEK